jgi:hypothetical protein
MMRPSDYAPGITCMPTLTVPANCALIQVSMRDLTLNGQVVVRLSGIHRLIRNK